jgi:AraC-like DNA-binding protein
MYTKLYSSRQGELVLTDQLPPSDSVLKFPGAGLQVATNDSRDYYFILQELPGTWFTARFYHFGSKVKDNYTWVSDSMITLRMGCLSSFQFNLPHMGTMLFHQRDYNLLHIPYFSQDFTMGPNATASFMDIIINEEYLEAQKADFPLLCEFLEKVQRRQPAKLSMHNLVAPIEMLRWADELTQFAASEEKENMQPDAMAHHLLIEGLKALHNGEARKSARINVTEAELFYQVADLLESTVYPFTIQELAEQYGISAYKLEKGFKGLIGHSVLHHRYEERMRMALRLVCDKRFNSKEVADLLGYSDPQSFSRAFKNRFGYAPYRNNKAQKSDN